MSTRPMCGQTGQLNRWFTSKYAAGDSINEALVWMWHLAGSQVSEWLDDETNQKVCPSKCITRWVHREVIHMWRTPTERKLHCQLFTYLCPSSVKAKSPSNRSRKRYLGGSDILLFSNSSDDCWKTSSTAAPSFVSTSVLAAMYPSVRRVWRELTILDNTFTSLSDELRRTLWRRSPIEWLALERSESSSRTFPWGKLLLLNLILLQRPRAHSFLMH